jgi:hypothetical protein
VALYQNLNRKAEPAPAKKTWTTFRAGAARSGSSKPGWLDRMLGMGAGQALSGKTSGARRSPEVRTAARPRVEMVDPSGRPKPRRILRWAAAGGLLLWTVVAVRPYAASALKRWQSKSEDLTRKQRLAKNAAEAARMKAALLEKESAPEAAVPQAQGTPVAQLKGRPEALMASGGKWWDVDAQGYVGPSTGPEDAAHLGLPQVSGAAIHSVAEGKVWRLKLQVAEEDLKGLFPLYTPLATEVDRVVFSDPGNPRIVTHDGTTASLGQGEFGRKEARLASVLADLAPRGKKSWNVDLRYQDSAIVRMASR